MARKQPNAEIFDKIFELKWAEPFKPFALTMTDGNRFVIARWDAIGRSPSGKIIAFYAKGEEGHRELPITQIIGVEAIRRGTASARVKRSPQRSRHSKNGTSNQ